MATTNLPVSAFMTPIPLPVRATDTLTIAEQRMGNLGVQQLPFTYGSGARLGAFLFVLGLTNTSFAGDSQSLCASERPDAASSLDGGSVCRFPQLWSNGAEADAGRRVGGPVDGGSGTSDQADSGSNELSAAGDKLASMAATNEGPSLAGKEDAMDDSGVFCTCLVVGSTRGTRPAPLVLGLAALVLVTAGRVARTKRTR